MKRCCKCQETKEDSEFGRHKNRYDGLQIWCKVCMNKYHKEYSISFRGKEIKRASDKKCRHLPKNKQKRNEKLRARRKIDPVFKLIDNLRRRIRGVLEGKEKNIHIIQAIGCTPQELIKHIESQWELGMSWLNYGNREGQWSIDHIFPFHLCNKDDLDEIVHKNHWTNLRPMWHKDNVSRKYEEFN